jgi:hypothetical protein
MKETNLPSNYLDGLDRVCKEDKYAFMTLDNMAGLLQQKVDCKLEPLDAITQTTIAMALQPNSPYRGIINTKLVQVSLIKYELIYEILSKSDLHFILLQYSFVERQWHHATLDANTMVRSAKYSKCTSINFADKFAIRK